jgi:sepiapterin reductase
MKNKTSSQTILITGAGKGIGRSTALAFCKHAQITRKSINLFITARTKADLVSLAKECRKMGADCEFLAGDISDLKFIDALIKECSAKFGTVNCLVNNAGVGNFGDFLDLKMEDLDFVLNTNVRGTFYLTQKVFRDMKKRKSGHLFFVTSVAAIKPFEQSAIYCMSKFGQKGLVDVVRLHAQKCNVRVTNVMPGAVHTPMWGEVTKEMHVRMMQPEDIADAIVASYALPLRASMDEIIIRPVGGDL